MHLFLDIDYTEQHHPRCFANAKFVLLAAYYPCLPLYHNNVFAAVGSEIFQLLQKC